MYLVSQLSDQTNLAGHIRFLSLLLFGRIVFAPAFWHKAQLALYLLGRHALDKPAKQAGGACGAEDMDAIGITMNCFDVTDFHLISDHEPLSKHPSKFFQILEMLLYVKSVFRQDFEH